MVSLPVSEHASWHRHPGARLYFGAGRTVPERLRHDAHHGPDRDATPPPAWRRRPRYHQWL